jgi:hypothetical protein
MNADHKAVLGLLKQHGACLVRQNGHGVWRLPDGKMFTTPSTPSDCRAWKNSLSDLRRILGVNDPSRGVPGERREKNYIPLVPKREEDYSFLSGATLPSMKNQLKEIKPMVNGNGSANGNGSEGFVSMGECFACGKQWSMPVGEHTWHEGRIKADSSWRMPTRCKECREKREPVTVEVKPGVTVTTHVQSYKLPGREPNMRQEQPPPAQSDGNPRRSGVVLKPSTLVKLRALPFTYIGTTQLSSLLGTSAATLYKWAENRKMPVLDGAGKSKYDPMKVADWLEQNHEQWEIEDGYEIPRGARPTVLVAKPLTMPAPPQQAVAPEAANQNEKLSDHDLLTLTSLVLEADKPNPPVFVKLSAELRSRFGSVQPSRAVLKWMMSA